VRYWYEAEPGSAIGVVVPELENRRAEVDRHLEEILCPGHDRSGAYAKPWNISMGIPLARVPMIETAFDLLKLLDRRIDIQSIGRVLRSPWFRGAQAERNQRALLEKCLRDNYPRQLKLDELIYRAGELRTRDSNGAALPPEQQTPQNWNCPLLGGALAALKRFERDSRGKRPASEWAEAFDHLLMSLGWPLEGDLPPSTTEEQGYSQGYAREYDWQTLQNWRDGLRELATLDATDPGLDRGAAIVQLQQICRDTVFQPRSAEVPIQVLGLYEVNGLRFDHLWVLGLHNGNWPASAKPNPFIPGRLQRGAGVPQSSPQRELEVARTVTRRLLETAPDCVFSYPGQLDGEDVLASPLLGTAGIEDHPEPPAWKGQTWRDVVAKAEKPQSGPLQSPGRLVYPTAHGGSSILKHQALCPFRAFASNRLGADGLETPVDGISPTLHGSLVHRVLELFWQETRSQAALLELDEAELSGRLRRHVEAVTDADRGLRQRPAFRQVEADRIQRHVLDYLALDRQREAFEVIAFEKKIRTEINGQAVKLVIDRIDRVLPDEEIIIDYKTGPEDPKKWFGERPENPQLPLYAITAETTPAAVAFGIIRDDGCLYRGVVRRDGLLPGLPAKENNTTREVVEAGRDLPATITAWRQVLEGLMTGFQAGDTRVDPKNGLKTCSVTYCELQSLCRVGELERQRKTSREDRPQEPPA
jgi:probable DNA repair protein